MMVTSCVAAFSYFLCVLCYTAAATIATMVLLHCVYILYTLIPSACVCILLYFIEACFFSWSIKYPIYIAQYSRNFIFTNGLPQGFTKSFN